jgi:O-antigen/teichoic acid export membrane protein
MRLSHIAWNLAGLSAPLLVAAATIPGLMDKLGNERFGLLALAWGLIGYAGALDLGIGRALTQRVGQLMGEQNLAPIPDNLATAIRITLIAGLTAGLLIILFALLGGAVFIRANETPLVEISTSILLLAIALPAQAMSATYKGLNEAFMNFRGISILRAGLGVVNFSGPYAVSLFTEELPWLVATLVISRLFALFIFRHLANKCLKSAPMLTAEGVYSSIIAQSLFRFGGWVTVSSVVSPILVQADRFVIAATISAAAVSAYVLPYEVVVQSLILVGAVTSVMFPRLSALIKEEPNHWQAYFRKWLLRVALLMGTVCMVLALSLPFFLPLWIGQNLASDSILIGQILCVGVFANAIGSMLYALLHAKGCVDVTAKLHLIELPIFLLMLYSMVSSYGLIGAAWAWVARMIFDSIALLWCVRGLRA